MPVKTVVLLSIGAAFPPGAEIGTHHKANMNNTSSPLKAFKRAKSLELSKWYMGSLTTNLAEHKDTNGAFCLVEATLVPGNEPPPHVHSREDVEDELFYVLEGAFDVYVGEEAFKMETGECVFLDDFAALPEVPLWKQANDWLMSALQCLLPNPDVPGRLVECFSQAGLGAPVLFCEVPIGDGERSPIATWLAETLRTLPPQIIYYSAGLGIGGSSRHR
jgi:mannose-6-phosphate isomerase-like protein (cupin superfamily)